MKEQREKVIRKRYLTPEERIAELEADVLRLVECVMQIGERQDGQGRLIRGIIASLKRSQE